MVEESGGVVDGVALGVGALDDRRTVLAPGFWGSLGLDGTLVFLVWEAAVELVDMGAAEGIGLGVGVEDPGALFFSTLSSVRT